MAVGYITKLSAIRFIPPCRPNWICVAKQGPTKPVSALIALFPLAQLDPHQRTEKGIAEMCSKQGLKEAFFDAQPRGPEFQRRAMLEGKTVVIPDDVVEIHPPPMAVGGGPEGQAIIFGKRTPVQIPVFLRSVSEKIESYFCRAIGQ